MAFQNIIFANFYKLLKATLRSDPESQANAENFILEERLPPAREERYGVFVDSPGNIGPWRGRHNKYIRNHVYLNKGLPETFADENLNNFWQGLEETQYLLRLENLHSALKLAKEDKDIFTAFQLCQKFLHDRHHPDYLGFVEEFFSSWNAGRDLRPTFAGFWGEVKGSFDNNLDNDDPDWPNQVRDRFGLGHYDPQGGEPIPILLLRYRLSEVNGLVGENGSAAIPTVLDGDMNPFFGPTPANHQCGQALDLSPGNDYNFYCEIIHRRIDFRPEHLYRVGWITQSPGKTCQKARFIHLQFLEDDLKFFGEISFS